MQPNSRVSADLMLPRPSVYLAGLFAVALLFAVPVQAGTAEGIAAFEAGDYELAYKELKPEAETGDAEAQFYVAKMHGQGRAVPKDYGKANEWLRRSADQNFTAAVLGLGYVYSNGIGVDVDKGRAARLYREAANAGDPTAQRNLGLMYREGEGIEQSYEQAVKWFRKAAEQGDAVAAEKLGFAYYQGEGVGQDYKQAFRWFSQASEENRYLAQRHLAIMYDDGEGVEKDVEKAEYWFRKAIEHGYASDKFLLGEMYRKEKEGMEKQSLELFESAAKQGHMFGQIHYGMYLMNGWGTNGDEVKDVSWTLDIEGYAWTLVAYERTGAPSAKNAVEVFKAGLTRDDIKRAEWRARKILEQYVDRWD